MSAAAESVMSAQPQPRLNVYLQPGQLHVAAEPTTITTILASCVAICLFDQRRGLGGMNHYLLPNPVQNDDAVLARFGPPATRILIERLCQLGSRRGDLQAKVFGGANVIEALNRSGRSLGEENVACALRLLEDASIPVVASDVGGRRGRKLVFRTDDGTVLIKWL